MKKLLNLSIPSNQKLNFKKDKFKTLIVGVSETKTLDGNLKEINEVTNGTLKKLIAREEITGKIGNSVYLPAISGVNAEKSYFVGTGKKNKKISEVDYFKICQSISSAALASKSASVKIIIPEVSVEIEIPVGRLKFWVDILKLQAINTFLKAKRINLKIS